MLLREAMNFVRANTKRGWEKLPNGRKNKPEYAERAVLEAMVNHIIHRDYTVMGSEVHLDIKSSPTQFQTIIFASLNVTDVGDNVGDVSEMMSVSQRTIEREISILKKLGVLRREGNDKDGMWVLNE